MRTLLFLLGGCALAAACLGLARLLGGGNANSLTGATLGFVALGFAIAGANLWIGVNSAGYAFREELPIFLLIFLVPAALAVLARWKFH